MNSNGKVMTITKTENMSDRFRVQGMCIFCLQIAALSV